MVCIRKALCSSGRNGHWGVLNLNISGVLAGIFPASSEGLASACSAPDALACSYDLAFSPFLLRLVFWTICIEVCSQEHVKRDGYREPSLNIDREHFIPPHEALPGACCHNPRKIPN